MKNSHVTIFTDGSSRGNPGPGGWGTVVVQNGKITDVVIGTSKMENGEQTANQANDFVITELGGREKMTTNNRMELMACLSGLLSVKKPVEDTEIIVFTDSSYVINGITKWIKGWKRNGWLTKTKVEVLNRDLWEKLDEAASGKKVQWKYVGGHIGIVGNERCDHIATDFADENDIKLYQGPLSEYDLPNILDISFDQEKSSSKKTDSSRARTKAYSYVSSIGGAIETHHTWAECEKRIKGLKGAKYKKSLDQADEMKIIEEFGTL